MTLKKIGILAFCLSSMYSTANADEMTSLKAQLKIMQQQIQLMQQKIEVQEMKQLQQEKTMSSVNERHQDPEGKSRVKTIAHEVADTLVLSGSLVINASHTGSDGWSGQNSSDIILDILELGVDAQMGSWASAHILFLYEQEADDNLLVDEAVITIANTEFSPFYLAAGRMYVPFGNFESNMISDPITLTLAETREEAIQLGFELENGLYSSAYIFNGKVSESNNNYSRISNSHIDNFGFNLGYLIENENMSFDFGLGYISNIGSTDALQDSIADNGLCSGNGCINDYVGGLSLHAIASFGNINFIGEYIKTTSSFKSSEITAVNTKELEPAAWNLEAAYNFNITGKDANIAIAYQGSDDFYLATDSSDLFKKAWLIGFNMDLYKNTTLSLEWRKAKAYTEVKNSLTAAGDSYKDENLLQMNLSVAF